MAAAPNEELRSGETALARRDDATLAVAPADRLACRGWIQHHSRSFYLSSLLLPERVRSAAWALYAFCRRADDSVDDLGADEPHRAAALGLRRVDELRRRLDAVYADAGSAHADAIDRAFGAVVRRYAIPRALPAALLDGMEMDARGAAYPDDDALYLYCFRVAATVGLMMTRVMGCVAPAIAFARATDLGVAMQLTNIARDIGEDARRGRVYLPASLCDEVGLDARDLAEARAATPAMRAATRRLLERAALHYRAADRGVPLLPRGCRFAIAASRGIYSAIGEAIARNGYDSITRRAYVSLPGKLWRVARALPALASRAGAAELASRGPADDVLAPLIAGVGLA